MSMILLEEFFLKMDAAVSGLLEPHDANGHRDLPDYRPEMGPRYSPVGQKELLSVFRGEGRALFALARAFRPAGIADCFTGTGYAACCLAAGWPEAVVVSADIYLVGGSKGTAERLAERLGLGNVVFLTGSEGEIDNTFERVGITPALALRDPAGSGLPQMAERSLIITHDVTPPDLSNLDIHILGGSRMIVRCPDQVVRQAALAALDGVAATSVGQDWGARN